MAVRTRMVHAFQYLVSRGWGCLGLGGVALWRSDIEGGFGSLKRTNSLSLVPFPALRLTAMVQMEALRYCSSTMPEGLLLS